jgi:hypothetical protein
MDHINDSVPVLWYHIMMELKFSITYIFCYNDNHYNIAVQYNIHVLVVMWA